MPTIKAATAYRQVASHAESIKNSEPQRVETCSHGDAWAQGDVLFVSLESMPCGATRVEKPSGQLAPGATQGSRHCLDSLSGIAVYRLANPTPLDGPLLLSERVFTVNHPEHAAVTLPAGIWGIVYQRAFATDLRRVQD